MGGVLELNKVYGNKLYPGYFNTDEQLIRKIIEMSNEYKSWVENFGDKEFEPEKDDVLTFDFAQNIVARVLGYSDKKNLVIYHKNNTKDGSFGSYSGCYNFEDLYCAIMANNELDYFDEVMNYCPEPTKEMIDDANSFNEIVGLGSGFKWHWTFFWLVW